MTDQKKPLGILILHGFTGSLDTVRAVVPIAERLNLPWRMPLMRGHGTRFEDLEGVKYQDWYTDARSALLELTAEADRIVIVGLSMGALIALRLSMELDDKLAGLVVLAPAMRFADPLVHFTPLLKLFFRDWKSPNSFADAELAKNCTNYPRFPISAFLQLLALGQEVEGRLAEVTVPVTALYSRKDTIVHSIVVKLLETKLGSSDKQFVLFEKSGHEMLQDCETDAVVSAVESAIERYLAPLKEVERGN